MANTTSFEIVLLPPPSSLTTLCRTIPASQMSLLLKPYLHRHHLTQARQRQQQQKNPAKQVVTYHDLNKYLADEFGITSFVFPGVKLAAGPPHDLVDVATAKCGLLMPPPQDGACTAAWLSQHVAVKGIVHVAPVGAREEKKWHGIARAAAMDIIMGVKKAAGIVRDYEDCKCMITMWTAASQLLPVAPLVSSPPMLTELSVPKGQDNHQQHKNSPRTPKIQRRRKQIRASPRHQLKLNPTLHHDQPNQVGKNFFLPSIHQLQLIPEKPNQNDDGNGNAQAKTFQKSKMLSSSADFQHDMTLADMPSHLPIRLRGRPDMESLPVTSLLWKSCHQKPAFTSASDGVIAGSLLPAIDRLNVRSRAHDPNDDDDDDDARSPVAGLRARYFMRKSFARNDMLFSAQELQLDLLASGEQDVAWWQQENKTSLNNNSNNNTGVQKQRDSSSASNRYDGHASHDDQKNNLPREKASQQHHQSVPTASQTARFEAEFINFL
ncbi:hypothetical protein V1514DRAFT_333107 [Lipomyces japonicus]|uniref:uncharacterized protein n=1 Tax=Lipomyces japonicus TaxID=56871 RepID=UPI0034D01E1E